MKVLPTLFFTLFASFATTAPTKQAPIVDAIVHPCADDVSPTASPNVTVSLTNDFSGANARAQFAADGSSRSITKLYGSTVIGAGGSVTATSAQLVQIPTNVVCTFKDGSGLLRAALTSTTTFVSFGGTITLDGWKLACSV